MKKIIAMLFIFIVLFSLVGCYRYRGEHKDFYSVAINNIFGADGNQSNGEAVFDPDIEIIETDSYGRVLFFYDEGYRSEYGTAIVIMQKSENDFVYYYQDICYTPAILTKDDYWRNGDEGISYKDVFSEKEIEALKQANDWNKPLDMEKCTKSPIEDNKDHKGTLGIKEKDFDKPIADYVTAGGYKGKDTDSIYRFSILCNTDKYGRELYYVYGIGSDVKGEGVSPDSEHQYFEFAIIFNPDKSCPSGNVYEILDPSGYYDDLLEFKKNCGWDTPYN